MKTSLKALTFTLSLFALIGCTEKSSEVVIDTASSSSSERSSSSSSVTDLTYEDPIHGFSVNYPSSFVLEKNMQSESILANFPASYADITGDRISDDEFSMIFTVLPSSFDEVRGYYDGLVIDEEFQVVERDGFSQFSAHDGTIFVDSYVSIDDDHSLWIQSKFDNAANGQELKQKIFSSLSFKK